MNLGRESTVYTCREHEPVAIPLTDLIANGVFDVYPEVAAKGYFDINFRRGVLSFRASRHVGFIPLSDKVAIHVLPKFPITNLLWMVWRAGARLPTLESFIRGYEPEYGEIATAESLYLDVFLSALRTAVRHGVMKRYEIRATDREFRGALSLTQSVQRYYSKGIRYRHECIVSDLIVDNTPNRIVKHTALRLLHHLQRRIGRPANDTIAELRQTLQYFEGVDASQVTPEGIARHAPSLLRALPAVHSHYRAPLWLSYLIATRSSVTMDRIGNIEFETLVIHVSDTFERYVRVLLEEACATSSDYSLTDGNNAGFRLFVTGEDVQIAPDYVFTRGTRCVAIADAKYKDRPTREDRYELLSHAQALSVKLGIFVCPAVKGWPRTSHHGTTVGGISVYVNRFDLSAPDMRTEEEKFKRSIMHLVENAGRG